MVQRGMILLRTRAMPSWLARDWGWGAISESRKRWALVCQLQLPAPVLSWDPWPMLQCPAPFCPVLLKETLGGIEDVVSILRLNTGMAEHQLAHAGIALGQLSAYEAP